MSLLSFVLENTPENWNYISYYSNNYELFEIDEYTTEYKNIKQYFNDTIIKNLYRVQNPYQYGRFLIRKEMTGIYAEEIVLHGIIDEDDLKIALKYTCDYRRYKSTKGVDNNKHPCFYYSFADLKDSIRKYNTIENYLYVLVLTKLINPLKTQCDYYIKYYAKIQI
ncbi:uncharacterized protein LOC126898247 [Daktulosphaira vitifoliae]|uniref:uncharacterized protein LOC126898247 n=1 Tax=Daktulosphaira vitifoliae TaxID=58002 RepID=UPI0021AA7AA1|nr:uncharacterized protein LOC126898247 [Daktulosphaira vitifoliae]XP_050528149.1 uncharacterized protein LOC126898247 [Daktulosphaira vitifoliae]